MQNKKFLISFLILFVLVMYSIVSYNFFRERIKLIFYPSNKVLLVENWNLYKVKACCEFPINFEITNIEKINPDLLLKSDNNMQNLFFDPFMIEDKNQEKLFYEVCYFNNKKDYLCKIQLTIFEENKVIQNKVVLSDDTIHSYPQVIKVSDGKYILSITNNGKPPKIFELKKNELIFKNIPINENIMDATYFYDDELYYMIGTDYSLKGDGNLRIFYGKDPTKDMFIEHPSSPIKYGKNQNRISGSIFKMNNKIYRFAMNNEKEYGEYVNLYEILELNKTKFSEKLIKKNILLNTNLPNNIKKYHHISLKDSNYEGEGEIEFLIDGANISYLGMHGKKISNKYDISE